MENAVVQGVPNDPPDGSAFFEEWLTFRGNAPRREHLSVDAAKPYRYIWGAWLRWIASNHAHTRAAPWLEAGPEHLASFLASGISPSTKRVERGISEITQRRYWRLIGTLYEHAIGRGLIARNPARTIAEKPPRPENHEGQAFHALQWSALGKALPPPDSSSRWDLRDRAILVLLMECALSTGEVCELLTDQAEVSNKPAVLHLDGRRAAQQRTLGLSLATGQALSDWIKVRRSINSPPPSAARLFVSTKGGPMSPRAVFHLVATTVERAFRENQLDQPNHVGAQVLRNTRLVMWLNEGVDPNEVVRRAGYKSRAGFHGLLRHLDADAMARLRGGAP